MQVVSQQNIAARARRSSIKSKNSLSPGSAQATTEPQVQTDHVQLSGQNRAPRLSVEKALDTTKLASMTSVLESSLHSATAIPLSSAFKSGFVTEYLTPKTITEQTQALAAEFPDLVEIIDTGLDTHGYDGKNKAVQGPADLVYMRIGPKTADRDAKVGVFQYAAPHARERINPMTMMEFTEQLVRNYDPQSQDPDVQANTKLLQDLDIFVAINTNPDGHNYAAFDDAYWRKNRVPTPDRQIGVDINRNYPYEWEPFRGLEKVAEAKPGEAAEDIAARRDSQTYPGTGPASEKETQALLKVVADHPNIKFVVDWHSYGEEIRRPLNVAADDAKVYDAMHGRVQSAIMAVDGTVYDTVVSRVTKGTSDDHFYNVNNIYSTVMETGRAFTPKLSDALKVMKDSVAGAREFLQVAADSANGTLT